MSGMEATVVRQERKRGPGRPRLQEDAPGIRRMVVLSPELDEAAAKAKGALPWSEWIRGLIKRAVKRHTAKEQRAK